MAWSHIQVTIRCSNNAAYATTPYKEIVLDCYAAKPKWIDEEGAEITRDVGGYQGNAIARRRRYELVIRDASVAEDTVDDWDAATIDHHLQFLYARKLWIVSVTGSPRMHRTVAALATAIAFWTSGNGITLPQEVRRVSFDLGDGDNGGLQPVLVLEDVLPTLGVTIT